MAAEPRRTPSRDARRSVRRALGGVGAVLLVCGVVGAFIHPPEPPELGELTRSEGVSSSVGEGRQFCGRHGAAIGHEGAWVLELSLEGREHCVVAYPKTERERLLFASLPTHPSLTAWHSPSSASNRAPNRAPNRVWQVEGPSGMLVDYATLRAEAEAALHQHRVRQALFFGVGLLASAVSVGLGLGARSARPRSNPVGLT